jgi:hypothetical protein
MSFSNVPIFTQGVFTATAFLSGATAWVYSSMTSTNTAYIMSAGTNGSRVTSVIFSTNDSATENAYLLLDPKGTGASLSVIGLINVPLSAGTGAGVIVVDALASNVTVGLPIDNNGKRFVHLGPSDYLRAAVDTNQTSAKSLGITCMYENY